MSKRMRILIASSIHLEEHNTIYAFLKSLEKILLQRGFDVEIVFRDKGKKRILLLDTIRYMLWLLGMKAYNKAYLYSIEMIPYIMRYILGGINTADRIIVANDIYVGEAFASMGKKYILIIHGKNIYEVVAENQRIINDLKVLEKIVSIERRAVIGAEKIIIVDEPLKKYISEITGIDDEVLSKKTIYLPNPVDLEVFKPRRRINSREIFVITHVLSSSTLGKDYRLLYDVLKRLSNSVDGRVRILVVIVGDQSILSEEFKRELDRLDNDYFKIHYTGRLPNSAMPIIYSSSDIVLNPLSRLVSGISRVSLEAMLCGSVPATTPEGEVYPLIDDETAVILPRDPVKAFNKLMYYIEDRGRLEGIRRRALEKAREYVGEINERWIKVLTSIRQRKNY